MARSPQPALLDSISSSDGVMVVSATDGPWRALRDLHGAMANMREQGLAPRLTFVHTLATDGRLVHGRHPEAAAFVLGYRLANRN